MLGHMGVGLARVLSGALIVGLLATIGVSLVLTPAAHAALPSQTVYDDGLYEMGRWTGQYAFSTDGFGASGEPNSSGNLQVEKPSGATTVAAAYLTMPSKNLTKPYSPTATLNSSSVSFTHRTGGAAETSWQNWLADVTSLVSGTLDSAAAGGADINIPVVYDSRTGNSNGTDDGGGYTGVALTVIWNSTSATAGTTIFQFGHAATGGESTTITFDALPSTPSGSRLSLGIGWSLGNPTEVTYVDIATSSSPAARLTQYAGSYDDGTNLLDALITVGGVGDTAQSSAPGSQAADNELYDLDRFFTTGDTSLTIDTSNPSNNDTVFQLLLYIPGVLATESVTFNANGGSGTMATQSSGSAANLRSNSYERSGYDFAGWNTSLDGTGTAYADGANYSFSSTITLYAQWSVASAEAGSASTGIFLYIAGRPGSPADGCPVYYGSVSIKPNTTYILSIQSVTNPALTRTVLATGTTNNWGHADKRLEMGKLAPGTYKVVMTGTHRLDYPLVLTNYISVDRSGNFISLSPESLQPTLS
jgi:uncharacterized repeat protein (TIGR02543 family)